LDTSGELEDKSRLFGNEPKPKGGNGGRQMKKGNQKGDSLNPNNKEKANVREGKTGILDLRKKVKKKKLKEATWKKVRNKKTPNIALHSKANDITSKRQVRRQQNT